MGPLHEWSLSLCYSTVASVLACAQLVYQNPSCGLGFAVVLGAGGDGVLDCYCGAKLTANDECLEEHHLVTPFPYPTGSLYSISGHLLGYFPPEKGKCVGAVDVSTPLVNTASIAECAEQCNNNEECVAISWVQPDTCNGWARCGTGGLWPDADGNRVTLKQMRIFGEKLSVHPFVAGTDPFQIGDVLAWEALHSTGRHQAVRVKDEYRQLVSDDFLADVACCSETTTDMASHWTSVSACGRGEQIFPRPQTKKIKTFQ